MLWILRLYGNLILHFVFCYNTLTRFRYYFEPITNNPAETVL